MNSEQDEAGDGSVAEQLDAPALIADLDAADGGVWASEAQEAGEAQDASPVSPDVSASGNAGHAGYGDTISDFGSSSATPTRSNGAVNVAQNGDSNEPGSSYSLLHTPTPSVSEGSRMNSPRSSLRPFDRRFQAKRTSSGSYSILAQAQRPPHSRQSSVSTAAPLTDNEIDNRDAPWEIVRWTRLRRLNNEAFSEPAKRRFGRITCMAVASVIALGTSRGLILVFEANQQLKCVIGEGSKAIEAGVVTSVAISADYSTVAAGHSNGSIFTWEIARPAKPFLQILSTTLPQLRSSGGDGHVAGVSVLHLGFLGVRHTALVSADDRGMAFSHLATRGTGALGRKVKTSRILGRYPDMPAQNSRPRKPSSVLAFSPLPMGTAEYSTDSIGLVAMLTPYLLVIVSTTPIAHTQHKVFRPKDIMPHSAMSGALAWHPATRLSNDQRSSVDIGLPRLAYCWSNVIQILEVSEMRSEEDQARDGPPELSFTVKCAWRADEPIVALQWLSQNIIAGLTISQQLLILEQPPLRLVDSCDILKKHVYHTDLFSSQLSDVVEKVDNDGADGMHGVVADGFYMSFRSYMGRIFILGFNDVSGGALSNWADRLLATMEHGDYVGAIRLACSYYTGEADIAPVGLPGDQQERHSVVGGRLLELIGASLKYAFGRNPDATDQRASDSQLHELVEVCFDACQSLSNPDFLFADIYSYFESSPHRHIFFDALQTRVLDGELTTVPPDVLKTLINDFMQSQTHEVLEELICSLNPTTMDLDQVTRLCKTHELFDALFYVWSQGIHDYTTILGDLLNAIGQNQISEIAEASVKIFTFLSYTLTGRTYPSGDPMGSSLATKAKAEVYAFLCLGSRASADGMRTKLHRMRQLLSLDVAAFMSMLNEAFEDPFLIGAEGREDEDTLEPLTDEQRFGLTLNRQYILDILIDFVASSDLPAEATIYLDMFIARTVAKYPFDILLKDQTKHNVLIELCEHASEENAEECELSVEYLLSNYHPPDLISLVEILRRARFYRVVKSIYRSEGQYDKLLEMCVEDKRNSNDVFDCIDRYLRPGAQISTAQKSDFDSALRRNLPRILEFGVAKAAATFERTAPGMHSLALAEIENDEHAQYVYLREIMERPGNLRRKERQTQFSVFNETYIRLLCDFDPHHVRSYVETINYGDLKLQSILPALESSGMIDSVVVLMAREGQLMSAMKRLVEHLLTLGSALQGLLEKAVDAPDSANIAEAAEDLAASVDKYTHVGIWLCTRHPVLSPGVVTPRGKRQDQTRSTASRKSVDVKLTAAETMWLELIDTAVGVARTAGEASQTRPEDVDTSLGLDSVVSRLRAIVQTVFTALLREASTEHAAPEFLPILRAFLERAARSSPSLAHLREVLAAIFSAYAFEEGILGLASQLLDKDLFIGVEEVNERRRRGWRPLGLACGGCGKKLWGPGAGSEIWYHWRDQQEAQAMDRANETEHDDPHPTQSKGKQNQKGSSPTKLQRSVDDQAAQIPDDVVVFACRHLFHRKCLSGLLEHSSASGSQPTSEPYTCPLEAA